MLSGTATTLRCGGYLVLRALVTAIDIAGARIRARFVDGEGSR